MRGVGDELHHPPAGDREQAVRAHCERAGGLSGLPQQRLPGQDQADLVRVERPPDTAWRAQLHF